MRPFGKPRNKPAPRGLNFAAERFKYKKVLAELYSAAWAIFKVFVMAEFSKMVDGCLKTTKLFPME